MRHSFQQVQQSMGAKPQTDQKRKTLSLPLSPALLNQPESNLFKTARRAQKSQV